MTDGWSEGQFLDAVIDFVVRTHQERGYWTWVRQACQIYSEHEVTPLNRPLDHDWI